MGTIPYPDTSRRLAGLLAAQLALLIVPFVLLRPLVPADYLAGAAAHGGTLRLAIGLLYVNGLVAIGIATTLWRALWRDGEVMALHLLLASGLWFALQCVDNAHLMAMLSLSERVAREGATDLLGAMGGAVRATRRWVHYTTLFTYDLWFLGLYAALARRRLVPRPLSAFGLLTATVHFFAIVLPFFLGSAGVPSLGASVAGSHVALIAWLALRGLRPPVEGSGEAGAAR